MSEEISYLGYSALKQRFIKKGLGVGSQLVTFDKAKDKLVYNVMQRIDQAIDARLMHTTGKNQEALAEEECARIWSTVRYNNFLYDRDSNEDFRHYGVAPDELIIDQPWTTLTVEVDQQRLDIKLNIREMVREHAKKHYPTLRLIGDNRPKLFPAIQVSQNSLDAFDTLLTEEMERKPPALLDLAAVARIFGLDKLNISSKTNRDSRVCDQYTALVELFSRLQNAADALAEQSTGKDGVPPAKLVITQERGLSFAMEKPESEGNWLLARESLPEVRAYLGLAPEVGRSSIFTGAWPMIAKNNSTGRG